MIQIENKVQLGGAVSTREKEKMCKEERGTLAKRLPLHSREDLRDLACRDKDEIQIRVQTQAKAD